MKIILEKDNLYHLKYLFFPDNKIPYDTAIYYNSPRATSSPKDGIYKIIGENTCEDHC